MLRKYVQTVHSDDIAMDEMIRCELELVQKSMIAAQSGVNGWVGPAKLGGKRCSGNIEVIRARRKKIVALGHKPECLNP